ncbi:MAG: site-specific integrase [Pseudomonadota bacterium]
MEIHRICGNKVRLYRRRDGGAWHCSTFLKGREWRRTTKEKSLGRAKDVAEDWFLELTARDRYGELRTGKSFAEAAQTFAAEYEAITRGRRSPKWVQGHKDRLRLHLLPYFGSKFLAEITSGAAQGYRVQRMTRPEEVPEERWKPPARNTIHNEIVTLSMVLKRAQRHGWVETVPDLSDPYRRESKVEHRPWFTPNEYRQLYRATRANANNPKNTRYRWHAEQLHDFVLFMANTGLRPDEAKNLKYRDVTIVVDEWSGKRILEIEVRGKRGVGYAKSMPGAVRPFERMCARNTPQPTDRLFSNEFKKMFNTLLAENGLKFDRNGKARTAYSLRHSYICFRLLEGADIYQVAKNCRTSVEMIERHYAAHLKDMIDTSLVNVMRPKKPKPPIAEEPASDA